MMKIYLVGGAVRDQLLGLPVKEKDWVVVGASVDEMLQQGFRQVGKDFPVFLHPDTHEEYALARSERKIRPGYTGFEFDASPDVTLEEDLKRRDITINAMARDADGTIIDPYHGQADLTARLLRHVSAAFVEDPVRILRVARFAARLDFTVAADTLALMRSMVQSGEVNALVAERVWKELERALNEPYPEKFFAVLNECGALTVLFPEWAAQPGMHYLINATASGLPAAGRFACLFYTVPIEDIKKLCDRYKVPNQYRDLAVLANQYTGAPTATAEDILTLFESVDAFRREDRFKALLAVWQVYNSVPSTMAAWLYECYQRIKKTPLPTDLAPAVAGKAIGEKIREIRLRTIQEML